MVTSTADHLDGLKHYTVLLAVKECANLLVATLIRIIAECFFSSLMRWEELEET